MGQKTNGSTVTTPFASPKPASRSGPHSAITAHGKQEEFTLEFFDKLWTRYRSRVHYVAVYEEIVRQAGGRFLNDHIAFRTIASEEYNSGIHSVSRPMEALGYRGAGWYHFETQHLSAVHYQHPNPEFPKLFISELRLWEMTHGTRSIIDKYLSTYRDGQKDLFRDDLSIMGELSHADEGSSPMQTSVRKVLKELLHHFTELPWDAPERTDLERVNQESQYGAWVLLHGFNVNHFTALVNAHEVSDLNDIEKTAEALRAAGIPMKTEIEGERGSKLRQTATEAVTLDVPVKQSGTLSQLKWPYAYFEIAERGDIHDPETGGKNRFEGFLGDQATQLFQMTDSTQNPTG
jgi:hypothetical protein